MSETPETFEAAVNAVLTEMAETMVSKQRDYGPGNISKFGELGVLVRASDKLERLAHLLQSGQEPNWESLEDTWLDLANYSLIGLMVRRGWWGLPMDGRPTPTKTGPPPPPPAPKPREVREGAERR